MEISPTTIFHKTERGTEELKTRRNGLTPRLRQLLILFDGRRDVAEIARVLPQAEFDERVALLASDGYIAATAAGATTAATTATATTATTVSTATTAAPTTATTAESTKATARTESPTTPMGNGANPQRTPVASSWAEADTAAGAATSTSTAVLERPPSATAPRSNPTQPAKSNPRPEPAEDLRALRTRVTRALLDIVGPSGDDFAIRIERTGSVGELRALVPALLSVVEAVGGRRGVDRFLERCGPL